MATLGFSRFGLGFLSCVWGFFVVQWLCVATSGRSLSVSRQCRSSSDEAKVVVERAGASPGRGWKYLCCWGAERVERTGPASGTLWAGNREVRAISRLGNVACWERGKESAWSKKKKK